MTAKFDGIYYRAFLKAPFTGKYNFFLVADDQAEFFIQTTNFSTTRPTKAAAKSNWNPYRNYWYEYLDAPQNTTKTISDTISLTQDEYYYIEL